MNIYEKLKSEEGIRIHQYICTGGYPTIGVGTKLPLTQEEMEMLSEYRGVRFRNPMPDKIYEKEAILLLAHRLEPLLESLNNLKAYKKCHGHDNARVVLVDVSYQLGFTGLKKFKKMLRALENKNFGIASLELLSSKYAKQTPNRAKRNAKLLMEV
jgi:lysozyme